MTRPGCNSLYEFVAESSLHSRLSFHWGWWGCCVALQECMSGLYQFSWRKKSLEEKLSTNLWTSEWNSQPTSGPLNGIFFSLLTFDVLGLADLWLISRNKACLFWLMLVDQVRSNLHYPSSASGHIQELIQIKHALDHQFSWTESPEEKLSTTFRTLMAFFSLLGFDLWRFADLWLIDVTSTKLACFLFTLVDKVRSQSTWSEFSFRS